MVKPLSCLLHTSLPFLATTSTSHVRLPFSLTKLQTLDSIMMLWAPQPLLIVTSQMGFSQTFLLFRVYFICHLHEAFPDPTRSPLHPPSKLGGLQLLNSRGAVLVFFPWCLCPKSLVFTSARISVLSHCKILQIWT